MAVKRNPPCPYLNRLNKMAYDKDMAKLDTNPHANPYPLTKRFKPPKTAAQLEKLIIAWCKETGSFAYKVSVTGRYVPGYTKDLGHTIIKERGKYIKGSTQKGIADIQATINGRSVQIEVKFSKGDRQRAEQKIVEQEQTAAGGVYIIVRTLAEFVEWYETYQRNTAS